MQRNHTDKECGQAMRRRIREEERRRENERRLDAQRVDFERKCEVLRKKAAAGDDAARAKNEGGVCENRVGEKEKEPQPLLREGAPRSDDRGRRSGKPKRRNRGLKAKVETGAETKAAGVPALSTPAKKEHPELHVIAQLTPLASPLPCGEASLHSGNGETCRQSEGSRTSMGSDHLFELPSRCSSLDPAITAPTPAVIESTQTREAAADVLFEPQLSDIERPWGSDSTVAAIVPIVKIGRASAAFYRYSEEPGNTRQPQKLSRGRGRGRGFGWHGRGGWAPRGEFSWTNWG